MIKAIFFDLFNTLVTTDPTPEDHRRRACRECGIEVSNENLRRGFWTAGDFFSQEDARLPLEKRSPEERENLWTDYEAILLREAGVNVSRDVVIKIRASLQKMTHRMMLFEDALPTLALLRGRGLKVGVISNLHTSVEDFCAELGLGSHLDFALTSHEVGFAKPRPEIFRAALGCANARASEAIHVGDQYHADVTGAQGAGIKPLLLDRDGLLFQHHDCQRIRGLGEILNYL
ncbi:MAG: HAD family hydrolase [Dehalococcoidia bacterium]|nr:HAD family hydrolase [Dehalococcoidia bacterium]